MCHYHTLRVEITLVRIEITFVSAVITFVLVKITLRVAITLCVWKLHSACRNHILRKQITLCIQNYTRAVFITECV
jgi:hypothetical protein